MGPHNGRTVYVAQDEADDKKCCKDKAVNIKDAL